MTEILSGILDQGVDLIMGKAIKYAKEIYNLISNKDLKNIKDYSNSEGIESNVRKYVEITIKNTFGKQMQETINELLVNTEDHKAFCQYLIEQGKIFDNEKDQHGDEYEAYYRLIGLFVEESYQNERLVKWRSILEDEQFDLIQNKRENQIHRTVEKTNDTINILSEGVNDIINEIHEIRKDVKVIKQNTFSPSSQPIENSTSEHIEDDNQIYLDKYGDALFLEKNF